ncbi:hypothetical protein ACA910_020683 [Epithemia clementina (nom. ined.)]
MNANNDSKGNEAFPGHEVRLLKKWRKDKLPATHQETVDREDEHPMLRRMHAYTPAPDLDDTTTESAVKHDKAAVPVWLWDDQIRFMLDVPQLMDHHLRAIAMLRNRILLRWKRNVYRSWREWWNANSTALISKCPVTAELIRKRGNSACSHARDASFWSLDCGSSVFFWRWPEE